MLPDTPRRSTPGGLSNTQNIIYIIMKKSLRIITFAIIAMLSSAETIHAESPITIKGLTLDRVAMGGRMYRMGDNGLFLDDAGMSMEATLSLTATGMTGQRLIAIINPLDAEGNILADSEGEAMTMIPFRVTGDGKLCTMTFRIPYGWLPIDQKKKKIEKMQFGITVMNAKKEEIFAEVYSYDPRNFKTDRENMPNQLMGDLFSGGGGNGPGMGLGDLLGGMFGGNTATTEHLCGACDGMGVCPQCYGDAFFDPSVCRRCSQEPGVCRRCKGNKTETTKVNY